VYDMPAEIDVRADGPVRVITLNRPEALNAVNDALHSGLARLWPRLSEDSGARAAVLTGSGQTFSAGGDFAYLAELGRDPDLRAGPSRTAATWSSAWSTAASPWSPPSTARPSGSAAAWSR
jgi:enoyl-CoA hydratase/carnithine racemase